MSDERVYRWRAGAVATAGLAVLGLLYASPLLLAATVVPLGYVVYGAVSTVPPGAAVRVERSFANATPSPGDTTTVTLTVENVSESTLPDVRAVDGVPDDLAVVSGSPRACVALRPGEATTLTYEVTARRGDFEFADTVVRLRSFSAGRVVTEVVPVGGETELSSLDPVSAAPLGKTTLARAGTYPTDSGGEGLEFHSTREYRPGDSISRIHWRRFGKTGDLTTVSFREERAVRVVVLVDARSQGRRRPYAGTPTAASLSGYAAERITETLRDADVTTDVAAFGLDGTDVSVPTGAGPVPWVGGERENATALARRLFEAVQAVADDPQEVPEHSSPPVSRTRDRSAPPEKASTSTGDSPTESATGTDSPGDGAPEKAERPTPDGGADPVAVLLSQFPPDAHVLFASPVADDWPVSFVRRLRRRDYPVTVFSPTATEGAGSGDVNADAPTGEGDATALGGTVAAQERAVRLADLSATGATVVDWDRSTSIDVALASVVADLSGGTHG